MEQTNNKETMCEAFVEAVRAEVGKGIYVWGGNGEVLTGTDEARRLIETHETSEANKRRAMSLFKKRIGSGLTAVRAFDCSGLVIWALREIGLRQPDLSSRGLYALCRHIGERDLIPGDLVFHHDGERIVHVGVCVGNEQVECRGRDVGVVSNRRKNGYWNRFGRLPAFESEATAACVRILGGSVRVRRGAGTDQPCLGIAHRGETYRLLGLADNGWYRIDWHGAEAYITNNARYTEVQNG